jgi:hypothetical protein
MLPRLLSNGDSAHQSVANASSNASASYRSAVSNPSVNQA